MATPRLVLEKSLRRQCAGLLRDRLDDGPHSQADVVARPDGLPSEYCNPARDSCEWARPMPTKCPECGELLEELDQLGEMGSRAKRYRCHAC
jgi:hypothetical protein